MIIGITCDDYKKDKFRKALDEKKIKIISEGNFSPGIYLFKVESEQHIIAPIVKKLQKFYHESYTKGN